ncbi:hypothetical protein F2P81_008349 [Scophthalmus maximus]|uniref:Uncharacterized protein n=1 Tax=Scophthalmus maximus TaxID=52904 RepID=A0A6A4TAE1_SCOMX|nr:hypothetical protein F2P81_008349 [Scophthalmus maximus]
MNMGGYDRWIGPGIIPADRDDQKRCKVAADGRSVRSVAPVPAEKQLRRSFSLARKVPWWPLGTGEVFPLLFARCSSPSKQSAAKHRLRTDANHLINSPNRNPFRSRNDERTRRGEGKRRGGNDKKLA